MKINPNVIENGASFPKSKTSEFFSKDPKPTREHRHLIIFARA